MRSRKAGLLIGWMVAVVLLAPGASGPLHAERHTQNVLLVTFDGLRWQELFGGADRRLLSDKGGVRDLPAVERAFWRESPEARRTALMPWFWSTIAEKGQVFGSPDHHSSVRVTNGKNFSYPGYNEILAGYGDPRIDSNDKRPNPNTTVLEYLQGQPKFRGQVSVVASWDVFPWIVNQERSGLFVNAGWQPIDFVDNRRATRINLLANEVPRYWPNVRYDWWTYAVARERLLAAHPRVLYVAFGETDDWAHHGRYDLVLDAAHRTDDYIRRLWTLMQQIDQYAGSTTLVVTTDHGRGDSRDGWKSHGTEYPGSDRIWIAVMGPDTPPLGVREGVDATQSQVAATVAALLGKDLKGAVPKAADPLPIWETAASTSAVPGDRSPSGSAR